ncbi:hypothetical protein ACTFIT_004035 [Dictyostelium discoideum]
MIESEDKNKCVLHPNKNLEFYVWIVNLCHVVDFVRLIKVNIMVIKLIHLNHPTSNIHSLINEFKDNIYPKLIERKENDQILLKESNETFKEIQSQNDNNNNNLKLNNSINKNKFIKKNDESSILSGDFESLAFKDNCNILSKLTKLLNKVLLLNGFNQKLNKGIIPVGFKELYISNIKQVLIIDSIPNTVTTVGLCDGFNQKLTV